MEYQKRLQIVEASARAHLECVRLVMSNDAEPGHGAQSMPIEYTLPASPVSSGSPRPSDSNKSMEAALTLTVRVLLPLPNR